MLRKIVQKNTKGDLDGLELIINYLQNNRKREKKKKPEFILKFIIKKILNKLPKDAKKLEYKIN